MFGKAAKAAVTTRTGRKASRKVVKTAVATRAGRKATKAGTKAAAKAARGAAKGAGKTALVGGKGAGKVALLGGKGAGKTALFGGKGAGKTALAGRALAGTRKSSGSNLLRYGFFAVLGFAVGALVARSGSKQDAEPSFTGGTGHDRPDPGSPAGRRGETWGSGTPVGSSGPGGGAAGSVSPTQHQRPEDPNRTGAEREYSDPEGGPLIGEHHRGRIGDIPEQQEEVEQRIRSRVGDDPRTQGMQRLNVEVNDGVAEIRGTAPSEDAKEAVAEIAASTEGVREVRNLLSVG